MSKITSYLATAFAVLIFINIAPILITNIKTQYKNMLEPHVNVASIKISDKIMDIDNYSKQLKTYFEDKSIKAILLEIDSGGGAAGSSQAIFNEINTLKKENPKPVVAFTINVCASGAYYIACTADYIITTRSAIVGSIGTFIGCFNVKDLLTKYNVSYLEKHTGSYKTVLNPFVATNPEIDSMLQKLSNSSYEQFTKDVATSRKLSLKEVDKWANGKIFTGEQALHIGLIDENGSKYNAIKKIRELALIKKDEKINWVKEKQPSAIEKLLNNETQVSLSVEKIIDGIVNKLQSGNISIS
jgi:protease-4